ncbi:DUF4998 domain-containing protein [Niabella sp. 22666]|uniref:DUF4998 domain-containing protein n=1 Tax=Niabella sp. 22666 TaxID=3453954 RepID=UPI003F84DDD3
MNMRILLTALTGLFFFLTGCTKMDSTYEQYLEKGGIIYPGRPAKVILNGGDNRIRISWPKGPDPSIVKAKISWNVGADSIEVPVSAGTDTISCMINNLPENSYSFTIVTYDKDGHNSVPLEVFGTTYGTRYRSRLLDRPVLAAQQKSSGEVFLAWGIADDNLGALGTEIKYVNLKGDTVYRFEKKNIDTTFFQDYKSGTNYFYRTLFLPDSNALDTFRTTFTKKEVVPYVPPAKIDLTGRYFKNYAAPFVAELYDGARFGTLKDWTINSAVLNQGATGNKIYGGYDNINSGRAFGVQKWGDTDPAINNGKIYQTFTLPAGEYDVIWTTDGTSSAVNRGMQERYVVAALGSTLPDVSNLSSALSSVSFVTGVDRFNVKTTFTLQQSTKVSIGILINFTSGQQAFRAGGIKLMGPDL